MGGVCRGFYKSSLGENSLVQLELSFIQKGSRQVPDSTNNYVQYRTRANYIEIPLLYQLRWNDLSFELGPALDINVTQSEESNNQSVEPDPEYLRFHLSGIFGINYHFSRQWHVNFRTNISISPARKIGGALGTANQIRLGGGGWRHVVLSTSLVYRFE
ncbi:MAG: outer membrane beta-barrel protein [Owenweeksia sp.]|nr:outer membrane beta-barrel protein [Owenweeksia sp.]